MLNPLFNEDALKNMIKEAVKDALNESHKAIPQVQIQAENDKPLRLKEAAFYLSMAPSTLYNNVSAGNISSMKRGKFLYFSKKSLDNYLKSGTRKSAYELSNELGKR